MRHRHHIIPKHAGGTDEPSNIVYLSVEDHAEAHRILFEKYGKKEDELAWKGLSGQISKEEILKEIYRENGRKLGLSRRGKPAHNKGKPMSEEQKQKLRKPKTPEALAALRESYKTRNTKNMGKYVRTDETKRKLREAALRQHNKSSSDHLH